MRNFSQVTKTRKNFKSGTNLDNYYNRMSQFFLAYEEKNVHTSSNKGVWTKNCVENSHSKLETTRKIKRTYVFVIV